MNFSLAMNDPDRFKTGAKKLHGSVKALHLYPRDPAEFVVRLKDVTEDALHGLRGLFLRIERNLAFSFEADRADIVETQDMVGMGVRVENGVKPRNLFSQGLLTEIRSRIDQDGAAVVLH